MQDNILLEIKNLSTCFFTHEGTAKVVQNVSFAIKKGETFALVGESGCGKSVTALSIMRLVPEPQGKIVSGEAMFEGRNLLTLSEKKMRQIRGNKIAMVFQEPMTSLNPVYTVGNQIAETVKQHQRKSEWHGHLGRVFTGWKPVPPPWADAVEMLRKVGIANPEQRARQYPHQLSGGMQQRIMIAMAVSCEPALLIADEPTTALDVTIQAQILDLLDELQKQNGMSILLITHDLGVVAERADDVAVMYASRIVEIADSHRLLAEPYHPYTRGLLQCLPRLGQKNPQINLGAKYLAPQSIDLAQDRFIAGLSSKRLPTIPGAVPEPLNFPTGCKFHPRCPIGRADKRCQTIEPELRQIQQGRSVACWYAHGYETKEEHKEYKSKYGKRKWISSGGR